ncbi:MAG: helix-turn-helix transcriptional regulator [Calditrichaeota bacterium]|nr:helix-turn-helix transcriptional regulator [Calditrichota bacterium]
MIDKKNIGKRIDTIRLQLGLTQQELAAALRISQSAISKYLNNRLPPADVLYRLAVLGQTTVEWILTGKKTYWYGSGAEQVREEDAVYDTDLTLARKISRLPEETRQAVITLIKTLSRD